MNSFMVVGVVVFACAFVCALGFAASLLAVVAFRFAPSLGGTILALTTSDVAYMLRQMPVYPVWWPGREAQPPKKIFVMLAVNPINKPHYFCGFDPLHRAVFTSDKENGMKLDFGDRFVVRRVVSKLEDEGLEIFIVFNKPFRPGARKLLVASRRDKKLGTKWFDLGALDTTSCHPPLGIRAKVPVTRGQLAFLKFVDVKRPLTELRTVKHGREN
jgi:hypothetical protein